jgi:photosystem II stability/assembly factor-like uncharacterized protein
LALVGLLFATALHAATSYDFYICANINQDYVIGKKVETTNGLYRYDAATGTWQHFGYNDITLSGVAVDPRDPNVIYTTSLNGIWVSHDGGESWKMTNDWTMTEGRDVAVDPSAPDTVYLALPDGVAVSTDRGQTWERRENGLPERGKYTQTIAVDRSQQGRVLAGCEKGIFLTTDSGASWTQVLSTTMTVNDLEQSPHDPAHWLAVTDNAGAWQSRDGGETWQRFDGLPHEEAIYSIAFDATTAGRFVISSWTHGIWTSEDGGATWTNRNAGLPEDKPAWRAGIDPNTGRLFASIYKDTLYQSDDFGRTWTPASLEGSQVHAFVAVPSN